MMRKILFPLILGLGGIAILVALGTWQLQRLEWKEGVLAEIESRIAADPVPLPDGPDPATWNRSAVTVDGTLTGQELHVLTSGTAAGTGYRVIARLDRAEDAILVDLGLLPLDAKTADPATGDVQIIGNLLWPDDLNTSTPEPDVAANIWFARDVAAMADALDTAPLLVAVREMSPLDPRVTPLPVDTAGIKNDHLEYAITWFGLALVWAAMTVFLIRRTLKGTA